MLSRFKLWYLETKDPTPELHISSSSMTVSFLYFFITLGILEKCSRTEYAESRGVS